MTSDAEGPRNLKLDQIEVSDQNVRKFDRDPELDRLAESIKSFGVLQPVVVTPRSDGRFDLIIGQRRFLASRKLGLKTIPAYVREEKDPLKKLAMSLSENVQRRALPYKDTIRAMEELRKKHSPKKIAELIGLSLPTVHNYLAAIEIPEEIQDMVEEGEISRLDAGRAWSASGGDVKKAIAIARELPRLTKKQKDRFVREADRNPSASAGDLIKKAKEAAREQEVVIVLTESYYSGLSEAAKEQENDIETVARRVLMDWLDENAYVKRRS